MTDTAKPIQLNLQVSALDATDEDIDQMTRQLLSELREADVESAELTRGKRAPAGSKGDPVTIGSIAVLVLPAVLPKIVELVQSWAQRGGGRSVKFKGKVGEQDVEFEGAAEDLQKLVGSLQKGNKNERQVRAGHR